MKFRYSVMFGVLIFSAMATLGILSLLQLPMTCYFEVTFLQSSTNGTVALYYDVGRGLNETDSTRAAIIKSDNSQHYKLPLPDGNYHALRFDPIGDEAANAAKIVFTDTKIVDANGTVLQTFAPQQFIPLQQIQILKAENNTVQFTAATGANDPNFNVLLEAPFSLHSTSIVPNILITAGLVFVCIFFVVLLLLWYLPCLWFTQENYVPIQFTKYYLIAVLAFIASFAIMSQQKHPDEGWHIAAAKYYMNHWLPPAVGDKSAEQTYSAAGVSYIDTWGLDYFLAGKIGYVLKPLIDEYIATRFFNVVLFGILLIVFFRRSRQDAAQLIPISVLLITPQIWYIFSYTNNDALPLFLSLLIISEIIYPNSPLNRFLNAKSLSSFWYGGVLFGLLLGILLISKPYYYTFLLFIGTWLIYSTITLEPSVKNFPAIRINQNLLFKYFFILVVALSVFLARFSLDVAINGESTVSGQFSMNLIFNTSSINNKLSAYREKMAIYPLKPSTAKNDLPGTGSGVFLKAKGIKYTELFTKLHWHTISFNSFVGVYDYRSGIKASPLYYSLMAILLTIFAFYVLMRIVLSKERSLIILMLIALLAIGLTIFISTYHSWVNDFIPAGRYLFPILGILGLLIYQSRFHLHNWVVNGFILSLFWMSVYSFLFVAMRQINN